MSGELVPISPDRWPAVVGSEQDVVSIFLTVQESKTQPHQVWGLRQVGLLSEGVKPGLRQNSLTSSECFLGKSITDFSLALVAFEQKDNLSKTTKLILLDSLLQEVCIESGLSSLVIYIFIKDHKRVR